ASLIGSGAKNPPGSESVARSCAAEPRPSRGRPAECAGHLAATFEWTPVCDWVQGDEGFCALCESPAGHQLPLSSFLRHVHPGDGNREKKGHGAALREAGNRCFPFPCRWIDTSHTACRAATVYGQSDALRQDGLRLFGIVLLGPEVGEVAQANAVHSPDRI